MDPQGAAFGLHAKKAGFRHRVEAGLQTRLDEIPGVLRPF
jgi:hypothetical protein